MPRVRVGDSVMLVAGGSEMNVVAVESGSVTCAWSYRDTGAGWLVVARGRRSSRNRPCEKWCRTRERTPSLFPWSMSNRLTTDPTSPAGRTPPTRPRPTS